jgi:hypothetical protein
VRFRGSSIAARLAASLVTAIASCLIWLPILHLPPRLVDEVGVKTDPQRFLQIIVVGVIVRDSLVQKPVPMHGNPEYPLQLRRLEINVENVLHGSMQHGVASVFYFAFAGGFDGPQPLGWWEVGSRRVFWLRRDGEVLRTACDGFDSCTRGVYSGAHPHFTPEPEESLMNVIADIVLTRGDGNISEDRFAGDIRRGTPGSEDHLMEKYRDLALTEGPLVKAAACTGLWRSTTQWSSAPTRELAVQYMQVAACRCTVTPRGEPDCGPEGVRHGMW